MTVRAGRYYNYNFSGPITDTATYINNRRTGWSYNADGEVTSTPLTSTDQPRTMTYDAAGQMVSSVETGTFNTTTYTASYDGDGEVAYESSTISPGTSESSFIVRSSVLGEVLTRLNQFGNKKNYACTRGGIVICHPENRYIWFFCSDDNAESVGDKRNDEGCLRSIRKLHSLSGAWESPTAAR